MPSYRSIFQSVCVIGYCMCPLVLASFILMFVDIRVIRILAVSVAFAWATKGISLQYCVHIYSRCRCR